MKKIEELKIGKYVLTFDRFFRKSVNFWDIDVWVDHCGGSKTFSNVEDYNEFCSYLKNISWKEGRDKIDNRDKIGYGDFEISLFRNPTLTISFEMYNIDEVGEGHDEIIGERVKNCTES